MTPSPIAPSDLELLPKEVREIAARVNRNIQYTRDFAEEQQIVDDRKTLLTTLIASQKELGDVRFELKMVRTRVKDLENLLDRMSSSWRTFGDAP